jgi:ATP-dependent Clp protease adapter protein ClpS
MRLRAKASLNQGCLFCFLLGASDACFLELDPFFEYHLWLVCESSSLLPRIRSVAQQPTAEQVSDSEVLVQPPARVVLFNDEVHSFEEVIGQLIKALRCDSSKAEALTWEVHNSGKAAVFEGPMDECVKVSGVLEEIALHTQIQI